MGQAGSCSDGTPEERIVDRETLLHGSRKAPATS
jgi:hypothetical protein